MSSSPPAPAPAEFAFDPARAAPFLTARSHNGWLGLQYRGHGTDWVELELPWRADLIGEDAREVLASGPIVSLMDMASGLAIWTRMGKFQPIATLDLRVDYTRAARERVRARDLLPHHALGGLRPRHRARGRSRQSGRTGAGRFHDHRRGSAERDPWLS